MWLTFEGDLQKIPDQTWALTSQGPGCMLQGDWRSGSKIQVWGVGDWNRMQRAEIENVVWHKLFMRYQQCDLGVNWLSIWSFSNYWLTTCYELGIILGAILGRGLQWVKDGAQMYGFGKWKMTISFPYTGILEGGRFWGANHEHFGNLAFEVLVGHLNGDVKETGGYADPEFSWELWGGHKNLEIICILVVVEAIIWIESPGRESVA